ncbi:hypothetical protein P153DRAFT_381006 [Dothidotthia symphoricarpi CBS 119687]|uniref:Tubby C-terminal-like domain-containing protein n=1 Tax=Dothidotthia symphoricarpi CBS 119687 TaxID=1392245 RepID=A0A6A6ARM9_9PLEO|nr:uncharacterized protein P153DRAFT_381006 [Dothidotthia symphoricarpi CBS 119687]KAF2133828.1 hypothetical protein P153DRAFT_381006 [Dothidotthia symphoricarpi CBS 119687]
MSTTTFSNDRLVDVEHLSHRENKELGITNAINITSNTTLGAQETSFLPVKSLYINTKGVPFLCLSLPPSELEIAVHTSDKSVAYRSTRAKRSSGTCVLTDAEGTALIKTEYFFGPFKDPILHCLGSKGLIHEIRTVSKWTSRNHKFPLPDGRMLEWRYEKEKGFGANETKGTALVLQLGDKRIAALIRNDETRTPGSKVSSAANGGELVLSTDVGSKDGIDQDLVVATCFLMLKRRSID